MAQHPHQVNEQINADEVLLIDENGDNLGVMPLQEALEKAQEAGLDLVAVNTNAKPVVCKIMDYGKYKYLQKKKVLRKQTPATKLKEIRLRPKIEKHDLDVKIKKARDFIEHGNKVKVFMIFRGREAVYADHGMEIMKQFYEALSDIAKFEKEIQKQGNNMLMVLTHN
ncbi:MAG: translation initiation factor IF-3 [Planctomycetota bacterium]|nr:MAG: translation initiation factor IF-3 [Planctomycetota bacterium]